ncbi:MAG: adenylate/guanylate cyclase domain-containing protein [Bacteroidota bacterium]
MKWMFLFFFIFLTHVAIAQDANRKYVDSLINKLPFQKEDTIKVKTLLYLSDYFALVDHAKGMKFAEDATVLSRKLKWEKGFVQSKIYSGRVFWKMGNYKTAISIHKDALQLAQSLGFTDLLPLITLYIGQDYADGGELQEAFRYFVEAKEMYERTGNQSEVANCLLMISWVHDGSGNFPESSKANIEALKIYESLNDHYGMSVASANLAIDNIKLEKYPEAISFIEKANKIVAEEEDYINLASNYIILSEIHIKMKDPDAALEDAKKALETGNKISDVITIGNAYSKMAEIYFMKNDYVNSVLHYEKAIEFLKRVNAFVLLTNTYSNLALSYLRMNNSLKAKTALDSSEIYLQLIEGLPSKEKFYKGKHLLDSISGNWKNAYSNYHIFVNVRDSIHNTDITKKLVQNQMQYEFDKKEALKNAEQEKKNIRQRNIRNSITVGFAGTILFLIVVFRQRNKINKARKRSDELLLNILPEEVADELKEKGSAEARHFDEVTVMFTDFKGFTGISEKLTPAELVNEIHICFKAFDTIIDKYNIEKIKTIGDSYMCAGGLPLPNNTHAIDVVKAALEIREFMQKHIEERKKSGKEIFELRIGIHTGPVVAGIVGIKKFAYDIWGDTVNIASRMESSGEPGQVNISGSTYEKVKNNFNCIHRGKISAKNKGEIDMYFVEK